MVIALSGRRVDAEDAAEPRFPAGNVELVRARARVFFEQSHATALVSSAACGADLIALEEAGKLGLRRRVILPFERNRFRESSVTDRPGDWGRLYDEILDNVEAAGDLIVLVCEPGEEAYSAANRTILDEAVELSNGNHQLAAAVLVWEGSSRGADDVTEEFAVEARRRGLAVAEIRTR